MTIFILYTILYALTTIGIFIIAALVFLRRGSRENKAFALFTASLGLWVLLQFAAQLLYQRAPLLANVAFRTALALPAFFGVEFYYFTQRYIGRLSQAKKSPLLHYIAPLLMAIAAFIPGVFYESVTLSYLGITVQSTPLYYALIGLVAAYIFSGVLSLIVYLRHGTQNRAMRYRTRFLLFGISAASVIIFGTILFFSDVLLSQLSTPVAILVMVSFFGYAIVNHRLFDIRLIAIRLFA